MNKLTPGYQTTEFWAATITALIAFLNQAFGWHIPAETFAAVAAVVAGYAISRGLAKKAPTTVALASSPKSAAPAGALPLVALLGLSLGALGLTSCSSLSTEQKAGTAVIGAIGATIGAQVIDSAVTSGVAKLAGSIKPGNPYLDSAATGLRTLQGLPLVTATDIQTAIATFGDPTQPDKWKALGEQVSQIVKRYGGQVTADFALEASATALQQLNQIVLPKSA